MPQHITVGQFIEELQRRAEPQARLVVDHDAVEFDFWHPSRDTELVIKTANPDVEEKDREIDKLEDDLSEAQDKIERLERIIGDINDEVLRGPDDAEELTANLLKLLKDV